MSSIQPDDTMGPNFRLAEERARSCRMCVFSHPAFSDMGRCEKHKATPLPLGMLRYYVCDDFQFSAKKAAGLEFDRCRRAFELSGAEEDRLTTKAAYEKWKSLSSTDTVT